jgi:hypothetical protein
MTEDLIREADRYLAQGDYVRALDELRKAGPVDPEVTGRIRTALGRLRLVAAREFAVGRWSVAEGIFDAVGEHDRYLSNAERLECRNLVAEIRRCRNDGRGIHAVIETAAELAAGNQFAQSREIALQALAGCVDPPLVARLRHLLKSLPHPLGRLVYGFDSPVEVEHFVRAHDGAHVEVVLNESHPLGGGFARITFPSPGARIDLMDPPTDWSDGKELAFMAQLASKTRVAFRVSVGDHRNAWTRDLTLIDYYWNPQRLTFDTFEKRGEADWRAVTRFSITSLSPEPATIHVDEIRIRPAAPLGRS